VALSKVRVTGFEARHRTVVIGVRLDGSPRRRNEVPCGRRRNVETACGPLLKRPGSVDVDDPGHVEPGQQLGLAGSGPRYGRLELNELSLDPIDLGVAERDCLEHTFDPIG
jgi:hypothetical protein